MAAENDRAELVLGFGEEGSPATTDDTTDTNEACVDLERAGRISRGSSARSRGGVEARRNFLLDWFLRAKSADSVLMPPVPPIPGTDADPHADLLVELSAHHVLVTSGAVPSHVQKAAPVPQVSELSGVTDVNKLQEECAQLRTIVDAAYVTSCSEAAGYLDRRLKMFGDALEKVNLSAVLFSSTPLTAAVTKMYFQVILLASAFYFLAQGFGNAWFFAGSFGFESNMVRFVPHSLRNRAKPFSGPHMHSFGLLQDRCEVDGGNMTRRAQYLEMKYDAPVAANGWFVRTGEGDPQLDATHFALEASFDDGRSWHQVGGSVIRFAFFSREPVVTDACLDLTEQRLARRTFSLAPDWLYVVERCVRNFGTALFLLAAAAAGHCGLARLARWSFILMWVWLSALSIFIAAAYTHTRYYQASSPFWTEAVGNLIIPFVCLANERFFVRALAMYGIYTGVVLTCVVHWGAGWDKESVLYAAMAGAVMVFAAAGFLFARYRLEQQSREMILGDKLKYDKAWEELWAGDVDGSIKELAAEVQELQRKCPYAEVATRHYQRMIPGRAMACGTRGLGIPGTIDIAAPVRSLDQLYCQAVAMDSFLRRKVKLWAAEGLFPTLQPDDSDQPHQPSHPAHRAVNFLKWAEARHDAEKQGSIKWATIKSVSRAIEKVLRTYRSDVSFLVDIVRQSIVFEDVKSLTRAVQGIVADPDVVVLRIKNRLDPSYDSWKSAGYRDVALNIRIVNAETKRLAVDTHVVELQLMLMRFATMKQDEGHRRYVQFRNLRCE